MPQMKLSQLGDESSIEIARDGDFESLGSLINNKPRQLGFVEDAKYIPKLLAKSNIACVITTRELASSIPQELGLAISEIPRRSFYSIHNSLARNTDFYWKPFDNQIAGSAQIHPTAYIAPKNVRIGERCEVGPNVSILENSILENDVILIGRSDPRPSEMGRRLCGWMSCCRICSRPAHLGDGFVGTEQPARSGTKMD